MGPAARVVARAIATGRASSAGCALHHLRVRTGPGLGTAQRSPVCCMPEALGLHLAGITRVQPTARHHHQARQPRTCAGCQGRQQFHPFRNTHQQPWHVGMAVTLRSGDLLRRGARVVSPCRKVDRPAQSARGNRPLAWCLQGVRPACAAQSPARATGPESSDQQGPHTGAARARNDHHAVAQGWHQRAPLQAHSSSPWAPGRRCAGNCSVPLAGAPGPGTEQACRLSAARKRPAQGWPGQRRAVGLGHLSSAGHAPTLCNPAHPTHHLRMSTCSGCCGTGTG